MAADVVPVIHPAEARTTVQVFLPDGRVIEGPRGTQLAAFLEQCTGLAPPGRGAEGPRGPQLAAFLDPGPALPARAVGAVVTGELRELNYSLEMDARLRP